AVRLRHDGANRLARDLEAAGKMTDEKALRLVEGRLARNGELPRLRHGIRRLRRCWQRLDGELERHVQAGYGVRAGVVCRGRLDRVGKVKRGREAGERDAGDGGVAGGHGPHGRSSLFQAPGVDRLACCDVRHASSAGLSRRLEITVNTPLREVAAARRQEDGLSDSEDCYDLLPSPASHPLRKKGAPAYEHRRIRPRRRRGIAAVPSYG